MITGYEEVSIVTPGHGADCRVVGLQDGLEIESNPVPQGKLAR